MSSTTLILTRQLPQPAGTRPDLFGTLRPSRPYGRAYWCHADWEGTPPSRPAAWGVTTPYPGRALHWARAQVRTLLPTLDPAARSTARGWLDDLVAAGMVVRGLREGKPHVFVLESRGRRRRWSVHPVTALPLADRCEREHRCAATAPTTALPLPKTLYHPPCPYQPIKPGA